MSLRRLLPLIPALLLACGAAAWGATETERLNEWLDAQYEAELQRSPLALTIYGRKERYGEVDDFSIEARIAMLDWLQDSAAEMRRHFDYDRLTAQGRHSYDFWAFRAAIENGTRPYLYHEYVFEQIGSQHTFPVQFLVSYHSVDSEDDMRAYIARVGGLSRGLGQWLQQAQEAAERGIRPPRFAYEIVLDEARTIISGRPFEDVAESSVVWSDGSGKIDALVSTGTIDAATAETLRTQLRESLLNAMLPAYQKLIDWHEADMRAAPAAAQGVHALPQGREYYEERLRYFTHSDMSADEVHALGLAEVARIHGEMRDIVRALAFDGTLQEFFRFVRSDERFYFPDTDEGRNAYLARTRELLARMETYLPQYFGVLPKSPLVVKRVEPYREQDGAAQFYQVGTADGSRPGVYYVHLSDMSSYNLTDLETTAYHEGSPGHHMQLSIAKELQDIPRFRNDVGYSAYAEGWALYAEYLAWEMGAFEDPYMNFGRLGGEIWRAIRLVVDTGLHAKGWSEEQAVRYMIENSAIPEGAVRSEIQRYLVIPGQATSYKAGMLKIQALRAEAETRLGDAFDIRAFHDAVLGGGAAPLPVLERAIHDWIDAVLAAQSPPAD